MPLDMVFSCNNAHEFNSIFPVSRETLNKLEAYVTLLKKWQKVQNLISRDTLSVIWSRHILDCADFLQLVLKEASPNLERAIRNRSVWLDFGSGAGLPGLVVAILVQDERFSNCGINVVHLVESNARKVAFLKTVIRDLALQAEAFPLRVEDYAKTPHAQSVDIVSARAVASLNDLMNYALPFSDQQAVCYFQKGRDNKSEIAEASRYFFYDLLTYEERPYSDGAILQVQSIRRK